MKYPINPNTIPVKDGGNTMTLAEYVSAGGGTVYGGNISVTLNGTAMTLNAALDALFVLANS
ncbi:hypothetical protein AGMMS49975_22870 [Clostridia bacterium]|nr:hypothetical protein AGMMS49975_22870 [Clostridia bacterium]